MNQLIDEVLEELKQKYGISKTELDRMIDVQFKLLEDNIRYRSKKSVKMINLGSFNPSKFFLDNYDRLNERKYERTKEYEDFIKDKRNMARARELSAKKGNNNE